MDDKIDIIDERIRNLVEDLFVNGFGDRAETLTLTTAGGDDVGGWCRGAIVDRIREMIALPVPLSSLKEIAGREIVSTAEAFWCDECAEITLMVPGTSISGRLRFNPCRDI